MDIVISSSFHAKGSGSNPGCDDGCPPLMSPNDSITRLRCFPCATFIGGSAVCALRVEFEGESPKVKYHQSRTLPVIDCEIAGREKLIKNKCAVTKDYAKISSRPVTELNKRQQSSHS